MNKQSVNDLQPELDAIRQKLADLEAKQDKSKPAPHSERRPAFSKGLVFGLLPLMGGIVLFGTVLYGKGNDPFALFIDDDGNVGIGTLDPKSKLAVTDGLTIGAGWVETKVAPPNGLLVEGKVGIGTTTPDAKATLHVDGRIWDKSGEVMPVGTILPYAGDTAPKGWLMCTSKSGHSPDSYPELFAVIGYRFGKFTKEGTTYFLAPDLRGRFLRGRDGGAGRDPDSASRRFARNGGATGDAVGSVQEDSFMSHDHNGSTSSNGTHNHSVRHRPMQTGGGANSLVIKTQSSNSTNTEGAGTHSHTVTSEGGKETRPKNMYVNFIIKY